MGRLDFLKDSCCFYLWFKNHSYVSLSNQLFQPVGILYMGNGGVAVGGGKIFIKQY